MDILFEENLYQNVKKIAIDSLFVKQIEASLKVPIPSFEDLLGDKLTAFAPETTGIPYRKEDKAKQWKSSSNYTILEIFLII